MHYINNYFSFLREIYEEVINKLESNAMNGFVLGASILIPIFGTLLFFTAVVNAAAPTDTPEATVVFGIEQDTSTTFTIKIKENISPLNAAEVELYFDPSYISVSSIAITDSLCEERFVITKEIDNETGRAFYQCGTITPFKGASSTLAVITYTPLKTGTSPLTFGPQTNALAHDGYGTNVTKDRTTSLLAVTK